MSLTYQILSNIFTVVFTVVVVWFFWIRKIRASPSAIEDASKDSGIERYSRDYDMTWIIRFVFGMLFLAILGAVIISLLGLVLPNIFVSIFNFLENIALMIVTFYFSKHVPTLPGNGAQGGRPQ